MGKDVNKMFLNVEIIFFYIYYLKFFRNVYRGKEGYE